MQRVSNTAYRDQNGNVLRIIQDENTLTLAINDAEVFGLHVDEATTEAHDIAQAAGSELQDWSTQALKVRHARLRAQREG